MNGVTGRLVDDLSDLEPVRAQWDRLAVAAGQPYGAPAWLWSWWVHKAASEWLLRVVLVFDDAELIGVAPFFVDKSAVGRPRFRLMGAVTTSRVDVLSAPGRDGEVAAMVAEVLGSVDPAPRMIRFDGIPARSTFPRRLADSWQGRAPQLSDRHSSPAPIVTLEADSFESWMASKSSNFRQQMRRHARKIAAEGGEFRLATVATLDDDLRSFARLHHQRWDRRGGSSVLDTATVAMLSDVGNDLIPSGRFLLWMLDIGGRAVSSQIFIQAGRRISYWLGGFDDEVAHLKPSIITIYRVIEEAFDSGSTSVELGSGGQPYKYRFADATESLRWAYLSFGPADRAVAAAEVAPMQMRGMLAERLSPEVKRKLRRAYGTVRRGV